MGAATKTSLEQSIVQAIKPSDVKKLISKTSAYQDARIERGRTSGSGSDVMDADEFKNTGLGQRFLLQSSNLILTPIRFSAGQGKIFSMLDSLLSIYILVLLFKNRKCSLDILSKKQLSDYKLRSQVFILSSLSIFLAFSLFVSNGGTAIRYKPLWLFPLIVGLMYLTPDKKLNQK